MIESARVPATVTARVCVAIPTFRRPASLAETLAGIAAQTPPPACRVSVVVVDNDAVDSARAAVEAAATAFPFALSYAHVREPGLAAVRNFALRQASGAFDYLAMIDDDERPEPQWLGELLRVGAATGADAVIGPVPQRLPEDAPRWLRAGGFLDLPTSGDGASVAFGYSGNCLLRVASLERFALTFDAAFNEAGGEDLVFFRQLLARGGRVRFAARAVAAERIGPERLRAAYVVRLNFRRGNTLALCDRRLDPTFSRLALRAVKGVARVALGLATLVPRSLARGRAGAVAAACDCAHGAGTLLGLGGYVFQAYRRVDATRS